MMPTIPFIKMQAVGNDFVLLDCRRAGERDFRRLAVHMCDRRLGVGGDGLLVVSRSRRADFRFRMYNPDGSEDGCGNGLRCGVKYWLEEGRRRAKTAEIQLRVEQFGGIVTALARVTRGFVSRMTISMGIPSFDPRAIPLARNRELVDASVTVGPEKHRMTSLWTGSAHTVIFLPEDPLDRPIPPISQRVERHPLFPERTNVMWTYVRDRSCLHVGIWERGAGETLGCGTGACAVAVVAARLGLTDRRVSVVSRGGKLSIEWLMSGEVLMTGGAVEVFRGLWPVRP